MYKRLSVVVGALFCLLFLAGSLQGQIVVGFNTVAATCGSSNGSITVIASGGTAPYSYSIDLGTTYQLSNVFGGIPGGPYTITVKDATSATKNASTAIGDIAGPQVIAMALPASCLNNNGSVSVSPLGGTPPFQYAINSGGFQATGTFTGVPSGISTVKIKDQNGCLVSGPVTVPLNKDLMLTMPATATVCEGVPLTLAATSNGTSFVWTPATGLSSATVLNPQVTLSTGGSYSLTVYLGICQLSGSTDITVNPAPTANAGTDGTTCYGKSTQLHGTGVSQVGGSLSYAWSPADFLDNSGADDPIVLDPTRSVTYSLKVKDVNGCSSLNESSATVVVSPAAKISAGNDTSVVIGQQVPLHFEDISGGGFNQFQWSPATGLDNPSIFDPVATVTTSITYTVTATTTDGCVSVDSIHISAYPFADIFVPTAFSPNHDGRNDVLRALPKGIRDFKYFSVYDRWGNMVFTTTNEGLGWDGTVHGKVLDTGVFVWMTAGIDLSGRLVQRKGTVVLVR